MGPTGDQWSEVSLLRPRSWSEPELTHSRLASTLSFNHAGDGIAGLFDTTNCSYLASADVLLSGKVERNLQEIIILFSSLSNVRDWYVA